MLTILTGPDRQAGLSQLIDTICARAAEGIGEQILIVPEQYSFEAERALCRRGGDTISRFAEVLSFTRLASRVFSIYGGVSEEYLDEGGRLLCLYLAAERVKTQIKFYAASLLRPEFLLQLGKMMEEFLTCCVTPQQLLTAAGQMTGQQAQKLSAQVFLHRLVHRSHVVGVPRLLFHGKVAAAQHHFARMLEDAGQLLLHRVKTPLLFFRPLL